MNVYVTCTTIIKVDLYVASTASHLKSTFEASDQVALTNQLNTLTAPGDGQCS
jgi:hypothetical protein